MKDKTLWSSADSKFKPRNKQSAMIIRPSLEIFLPPPPPAPEKGPATSHEEARKEVLDKWDKAQQEHSLKKEAAKQKESERKIAAERRKNAKGFQNRWLMKYQRQLAKRLGLPRPSHAELEQKRLALPSTGKPF